jgi:signal transduction histidine kinase
LLTLMGFFGLAAWRRKSAAGSADPAVRLAAARAEMEHLEMIVRASLDQGEALKREKADRLRAEEDARNRADMLDRSRDGQIRLGRDLHDGIIQSLYATGLTLEAARAALREDPEQAARHIVQSLATLNGAIREVRACLKGLSAEGVRAAELTQTVNAIVGGLSASRSADLLQIIREAVSNALRHGRATAVTIRMHLGDDEIGLLVQDNGMGFSPAIAGDGGHGLRNMKARAQGAGGTLEVISRPGNGTRILVTLPADRPVAA